MSLSGQGQLSNASGRVEFSTAGYGVIRGLLPARLCAFLYDYAVKAAERGQLDPGDDDVPDTPARYADPFMESLLQILVPRFTDASGLALDPTYSYFRVYKHGDVLKAHRDRPACEVSATINLGHDAEAPWPIWIEGVTGNAAVALQPGDGMMYRGIERRHWREPFAGAQAVQVFLHYVDRNGPHRDWKFDRRPGLTTSTGAERVVAMLMGTAC